MLSCIVLVLVGTTDFDSSTTKSIIMGILAIVMVIALVLPMLGTLWMQ